MRMKEWHETSIAMLKPACLAHIARHDDRTSELFGDRAAVWLRLRIQIGDRQFRALPAESLGAAMGDTMLVGDADDQTLLALKHQMARRAWAV